MKLSIFDSNIINILFYIIDIMGQINFRMTDDEKLVIQAIAKQKGISIAELARRAVLKEIMPVRIDLAFNLLQDGQVGRKKAWTLSGLSYHEFMAEWSNRDAVEDIPSTADNKGVKTALNLDASKFIKRPIE